MSPVPCASYEHINERARACVYTQTYYIVCVYVCTDRQNFFITDASNDSNDWTYLYRRSVWWCVCGGGKESWATSLSRSWADNGPRDVRVRLSFHTISKVLLCACVSKCVFVDVCMIFYVLTLCTRIVSTRTLSRTSNGVECLGVKKQYAKRANSGRKVITFDRWLPPASFFLFVSYWNKAPPTKEIRGWSVSTMIPGSG